ncbi:MAG: hypothetical protein ACRDWD_12830 [Acidimicrobiia bacterium]
MRTKLFAVGELVVVGAAIQADDPVPPPAARPLTVEAAFTG